jgi:hypothetical protein
MTSFSVSVHAWVISMPNSPSVALATESPTQIAGASIFANQYSGRAPYRATCLERSTPRYVGVCSPCVRCTRLIIRKPSSEPAPTDASVVFSNSGSIRAASPGSAIIPRAILVAEIHT